ncbi:unnamed protein product [Microthlaspi erraticum]|uniref:Uncharacterized protein n=1 Tax=Microthlaspi erraticum TaxID=1685480 RepID=A0A6D2K8W5_9BRAS|nr:unnamed protein product [Microthlaspi erraticum]
MYKKLSLRLLLLLLLQPPSHNKVLQGKLLEFVTDVLKIALSCISPAPERPDMKSVSEELFHGNSHIPRITISHSFLHLNTNLISDFRQRLLQNLTHFVSLGISCRNHLHQILTISDMIATAPFWTGGVKVPHPSVKKIVCFRSDFRVWVFGANSGQSPSEGGGGEKASKASDSGASFKRSWRRHTSRLVEKNRF